MSTVEKGGATVFPYVKVHVPAVKGNAAFWYNLNEAGDDEYFTRHAACPVLIGYVKKNLIDVFNIFNCSQKWVANKWIRERGQEFRRPCPHGKVFADTNEKGYMDVFY
jgi:prolyl 4-hydroxylase